MTIKIYFNDKPLFLCDKITPDIEPYMHHDDAVYIDEFSSHAVKSMIHEMEQEKIHAGIFFHPDIAELKKAFWKKFLLIQAGGGLVLNGAAEILMIHRRGMWDLPKGKLDEGETIEACALREVEEETGVKNLNAGPLLQTTYHTYRESGKFILKESHWFEMSVEGQPSLVPQEEEQITAAKWLTVNEIEPLLDECFPSVRDVLRDRFTFAG